MGMPRRIDRDLRKAHLAEAMWQIIRDRGVGAVSVRSVADQAGVAVGSLRHVFPTRAELVRFSAELMVQRATDRIRAIPPLDSAQEYALEVVKHLLPLQPDSRAELEVNIALIAESPALPELVAIRDQAYQELEQACTRLVEMLVDRPRDPQIVQQGRRLHAIVDGLAIHILMHSRSEDSGWAVDIARAELTLIASEATRPIPQ